MGDMFTRSEVHLIVSPPKNMLTGLFQNHIERVSMPTPKANTLTLKAVKHGTRSPNKI